MRTSAVIKAALCICIVALWGVLMMVLAHKEGLIGETLSPAGISGPVPVTTGGETWKSIYFRNRWIGYVRTTVTRGDAIHHIRSFSFIRVALAGSVRNIVITSDQELDAHFHLRSFNADISGVTKVHMTGVREGGRMMVDISYGTSSQQTTIPVSDDFFIDRNILHLFHGQSRNVGDSYSLRIFNPLTLATEKVTARVTAKDGDRTVIETLFGGMTATTWIDGKGEVVREEMPNGWALVADSADEVRNRLAQLDGNAVDLARELAVMTSRRIENPRAVSHLKIRVGGIPIQHFQLENSRQRMQDPLRGIIAIDVACPGGNAAEGEHLESFLRPSNLVDSADPAIVAAARAIVGGEKDPWRASRKIGRWVYEHIEKTMLPEIPVASQILKHRRGDCNEHTVLFVALARAAGIPADSAAGLVYLHDGFYYHAWPKVYAGGWVHLDPTFGQDIADAAHFELVAGDIAAQAKIALAMGNITIDILEASREKNALFCSGGTSP